MDRFLQNLRTPITFFCIGVLFSVTIFWIYLEKNSPESDTKIEVRSSSQDEIFEENNNLSINNVLVIGPVLDPSLCKLSYDQKLFEQIEKCVELTDVDVDYLRSSLNKISYPFENDSFIILPKKSDNLPVVEGASVINNIVAKECINLNTASINELDSLPGIGESYAQKIIDGRPYSSKSDIKKVKGIGDKTFLKIESLICL